MMRLALMLLGLVAASAILFASGVLFERARSQDDGHYDVYVDRTPPAEELEIRRSLEQLLDDFNNQRWTEAHEGFASHCRSFDTAEELADAWRDAKPYHFELRELRVTEIHDDLALVESEIHIMDDEGTGPFGPDHGAQPWINSFTFEDGRWRACQ
jgi:hypothetical protein